MCLFLDVLLLLSGIVILSMVLLEVSKENCMCNYFVCMSIRYLRRDAGSLINHLICRGREGA